MPYTEKQIAALDAANLDFSNFDWEAARAHLKGCLRSHYSYPETRYIHIAYSLCRGRPIVGDRGIECRNTHEPALRGTIQYYIDSYQKKTAEAA
mgnify:CR=1 FL=1|jgi:hypothetical protein